jgi:hypothetical protein
VYHIRENFMMPVSSLLVFPEEEMELDPRSVCSMKGLLIMSLEACAQLFCPTPSSWEYTLDSRVMRDNGNKLL